MSVNSDKSKNKSKGVMEAVPEGVSEGVSGGAKKGVSEGVKGRGTIRRKGSNKTKRSEIVQPFEKPLPQVTKLTTRNMVTKLEFPTSDVYHITTPVANKVFNLDFSGKSMADARGSNKWHLTDEVYEKALNGYNDVIAPFEKFPRVYKLESIKEKMFEFREAYLPETIKAKEDARIAELKAQNAKKNKGMNKKLDKMKRQNSKSMETKYLEDEDRTQEGEVDVSQLTEEEKLEKHENELGTIIDPFEVPAPWVRRTKPNGEVVYVNEETKAVKSKKPGEVWEDKFSNLERLTPREDFSAWDYRETEKERRRRFKIQGDFERKMMSEIERRQNDPNDLEQVEDALFHIIDTIAKRDAKNKWIVSLMKKNEERQSWHPNTLGFRLDPLESIKSAAADSDDEGIPRVTDLDFNDNVIVSATGHVVATLMPWNLMDIHEKEREIQREIERARLAAELAERNKPLKTKIADLVQITKEDGSSAAAKHISQGLKNRVKEIPEKLPSSNVVMAKSKNLLLKSKESISSVISDPEQVYTSFRKNLNLAYFKIFPPSEEAVMLRNMMKDMERSESTKELLAIEEKEAEEARKIESRNRRRAAVRLANVDMSPKPIQPPDTTMITLTLLVDPPALYDMVPPPTWYDPATAMALHFQKELLGIESQQHKYRKPPRFLNARSSLDLYKNWENIFLKRQLSTDEEYEYQSLASSLQFQKGSGGEDGESESESDSDNHSGSEEDSHSRGEVDSQSDDNADNDDIGDGNEDEIEEKSDKPYEESLDAGSDTNEKVESDDGQQIDEIETPTGNVVEEEDEVVIDEKAPDGNKDQDENYNDDIDESNDIDALEKGIGELGNDNSKGTDNDIADGGDDNDEETGEEKSTAGSAILSVLGSESGSKRSSKRKSSKGSVNGSVTSGDGSIATVTTSSSRRQRSPAQDYVLDQPLAQYQLKAIAKQLWANYKDKHAGAAVFIKDVFDDTNRKRFENTILDEISTCACIPTKFFSIEEVRKLPPNDDMLIQAMKAKQDFFDEEDRVAEEKRFQAEQLMQENLDLVAKISAMAAKKREDEALLHNDHQSVGSVDAKSKMSVASISRSDKESSVTLGSNENLNVVDNTTLLKGNNENASAIISIDNSMDVSICEVSKSEKDTTSQNPNGDDDDSEDEKYFQSIETEEERKRKVKQKTRKKSIWGSATVESMASNASASVLSMSEEVSMVGSDVQDAPRSAAGSVVGSTVYGGNVSLNKSGCDKSNGTGESQFHDSRFAVRVGEHVGIIGTTPISPRQLCITISNPEHERHDPNHWMAKQMREETAYEKQLRRIEMLKILQMKGTTRVEVLREKLRVVKQKQHELNEIAETYLGPTLKVVKKVVKPLSMHIQKKSLQCAKEIGKEIRRRREMAKLERGAEDEDAITIVRKSQLHPNVADVSVGNESVHINNSLKPAEESLGTGHKEGVSVYTKGVSDVMKDEDIEQDAVAHAINIVSTAEAAAAIAQQNINSDEESKHRKMIADLRDKLAKEEEDLINDLETNSTQEERDQVEIQELLKRQEGINAELSSTSSINDVIDGATPTVPLLPLPPSSHIGHEILGNDKSDSFTPPVVDSAEHEVMRVLNVMCHTILNRVDERYDIYDEYLDLWDQKERPDRDSDVIGCQVSILVHVDDSLKQNMYLYDLQSDDIAVMLANQLKDRNSVLSKGSVTKHIVDINHKSVFSKRRFQEWEHLWVHFLSPTYFRYCTKPSKKQRFVAPREAGRLTSGVLLVNPTDSFNENQKEVFMGLIQPKSKFVIDDRNAAATLNFDVDDIGAELFDEHGAAKLSIYRPNLNEITKREVEKCKRIYRGFLDKHNTEMQFGLARGGLRANQYAALKDLETSKRIYDIAKQKLARDERLNNETPAFVPQITKISDEQFGEWMKEAKEEEAAELLEKKMKKIQQSELRKQEAEMRRRYAQQKNWMLSKLMQKMPGSGQELSTLVLEEIENDEKLQAKLNDTTITDREREIINSGNSDLKKLIISEEKITRLLFTNILKWFQTERKLQAEADVKSSAASSNINQNEQPGLSADDLQRHSVDSLNNEQDDDIISNISDDSALKSSVAGNSLASKKKRNMSMTGSAAEPVPFDKVIEYFVFARERFVMDQKYFAKMAEEQKLMEMAAKRKRRLNQMDDARKMMLEFSRDVSKKKKDEDTAREKERKDREENGGGDDESLKSASTASSATSQTNSQTASTESISIAKLKRNRFMFMKKEVARFSEKEMEVFPDLYWFKLTIQHPEFFECLKELPLMKDKLCTRDELVQFAKICTELAPYTLKAKDRLKKKREDLMNKKALRGKRFVENRAADKDNKNTPMDTEEELAIKAKEEYRRLLSSGLAEEALKRKKRLKAAKKRRKRREKAWLYAHQHMFIKLAGKPAFCVVCRDKMDMQWLDSQEIAEKKWKDDWESTLAHNLNSFQSIAKQLVEDDFMKELEKKKNAISSSQGSDQLSSVSSLPEAPGSYLLPSQMNFDSDAESINSASTKIVDIKEEVSGPSTKNEVSGTKSSLGESEANSEKNTTLSNSGRSNFMKGLSSKFSKSFSGLSSDGKASKEVESTSLKSESSGYTNAQDDTNTAEKSKPLGDDNNDDDLSRVSESKSEVSREGDNKFIRSGVGSALSGNTHDAKDDDSSKDEIFYAGASEYSGDLGALKDPDDIDQLKEFAAMGNVKTKGRGKNLRVDRGRTRRKGIVKAPIPLPDYMIEAGLAAIDPNGLKHSAAPTVIAPVVQTEEQIQKSKQVLSKKKSSIVNDSDDGSVDPARLTVFDKFPHEILLKVWNYDFEDKGDFLGYVLIPNEFIANPTKGIRKFPLLTDPSLVKPSGAHLALHGDIFCKLVPTRKADVRLNKQKPATNKMESFNENGNNSDSDSEVSSLASQSCRRKVVVSKAGTEPIKVAVSTPEPPKNMLQRFMSVKKVNTTKVMIESQEEERAIAADKEANDKKKAEEDLEFQGPCCWKFQIFKGVKLTAIDRIEKSSPIIEVCWKGNSTKKNDIVYEKDFQCVGYTSVKKNTLDPDWKGDDSAIFEFPPVWTSAPLPGRGESLKDTLKTGGYVSKNRVPADDPNKVRKFRSSVLMKLSSDDQASLQESLASSLNNPSPVAAKPVNKLSLFKRAVSAVKLTNRLNGHEIDNLEDKMAFKTKVRKALVEAEEVERRCMAREERRIHIHFREVATEIEAPFLAEQKLFEKNFSRLMQHLQSAPPILGRVRFLMSHLMKGGGTCTMCEDPATHRNVEVYAIPILYEEDEDELNRQVQVMLGRQHNSIIQILNYSVHQILGFSMRGHASLNERVAVVVCNNEPSVSLLEHIKQNYYSFTDADLRLALMQITNALMSVHRDGLVHRNIHPDAIQVKIKGKVKFGGEGDNNENDEDSEDDSDDDSDDDDLSAAAASVATKQSEADSIGSNTTSSKSLRNRPVYVLEDFWFLHNPRKSGCEYSMGRADWGNANTLPPEALNGNIISDKSDIWGLGVSVYMWATRGLALNVQDGQKFDFNEIAKNLPLKWGPWVLSFLRMCLERNPKYRASAHDLYQFLVIAKPLGNP